MKWLFFICCAYLIPGAGSSSLSNAASHTCLLHSGEISLDHMDVEILWYVNRYRESKKLRSLEMNKTESSIALQHSKNMACGKTPFGHEGLEARAKQIRKQLGHISTAGENVAYGRMSAKEVVDGWLNSPGHRRNIEGDFTLTGIGCAEDKRGVIYYTQIFTK
jgi:uncharacterized protein YkwD